MLASKHKLVSITRLHDFIKYKTNIINLDFASSSLGDLTNETMNNMYHVLKTRKQLVNYTVRILSPCVTKTILQNV